MHHAHTDKILEAPIFYVGGNGCYGYSKVNHSVPGVNMQDVCTLHYRLAVMLPLDTDLRSVLCVCVSVFHIIWIFWAKGKADLRSVSELQRTQHTTPWEDYSEQTTRVRGGREERHTVRQASGQTDARTEHS